MLKRIDESKFLSNLLERVSDFGAKYKGLPIVIGIALVFIGTVILGVDVFAKSELLEFVGVIAQGGGILIALIGLVIAIPLGE